MFSINDSSNNIEAIEGNGMKEVEAKESSRNKIKQEQEPYITHILNQTL